MISKAELDKAIESFNLAAQDSDFVFQTPFVIDDKTIAFGHITDYGSKNGTVVLLGSDDEWETEWEAYRRALVWCREHGYYCSILNPALLTGDYKRSYFREMLRDWGRF